MLTAKKLTAVILRLVAVAIVIYLFIMMIFSALFMGGVPIRLMGMLLVLGLAAGVLFVYAIPVAGLIADDVDKS
jgi:hypothetical protein